MSRPANGAGHVPENAFSGETGLDLEALRLHILRFFLDTSKQTAQLVDLPQMQPYPRRLVKKTVYALTLSGLLEMRGQTCGTWYVTSHLGWIVLATLREHESLPHKPGPGPSPEV